MQKLRIAIGATLHKRVKKDATGGTEAFSFMLSNELVKRGHSVTIFALEGSETTATLISIGNETEVNKVEQGQRLFYGYQLLESEEIAKRADEFDIIHINYFETFLFTPFSKFIKKPIVYTVHSDLFVSSAWQKVTQATVKSEDMFVFVSRASMEKVQGIGNKTFIHNGIDISEFPFSSSCDDYLLWLGRVRKKKGIKEAVLVALKSGEKLVMSGVMDNPEEKDFFEKEVLPLIRKSKNIEFRGPADFESKIKLYSKAKAFLCPISWEEPFGLTMVEAMACGTPVVAFDRGAVREIIAEGETGYIVSNIDSMAWAIGKIEKIVRSKCRERVEKNFTLKRMVDQYEELYQKLANYAKT